MSSSGTIDTASALLACGRRFVALGLGPHGRAPCSWRSPWMGTAPIGVDACGLIGSIKRAICAFPCLQRTIVELEGRGSCAPEPPARPPRPPAASRPPACGALPPLPDGRTMAPTGAPYLRSGFYRGHTSHVYVRGGAAATGGHALGNAPPPGGRHCCCACCPQPDTNLPCCRAVACAVPPPPRMSNAPPARPRRVGSAPPAAGGPPPLTTPSPTR